MHGRLLVVTVVGAALALPAAVANAKGPMPAFATIRSPGLSHTLGIKPGKAGHWALEKLTGQTGFFPAVTPEDVRPMLPGRPRGKLGPRYTIRYFLPRRPPEHAHKFGITQYVYRTPPAGRLRT
jgi:hypothetical protein